MIWEVFRQEREGAAFQHGGSLEAPNIEFAEAYAKEFYGRRAESFALWQCLSSPAAWRSVALASWARVSSRS